MPKRYQQTFYELLVKNKYNIVCVEHHTKTYLQHFPSVITFRLMFFLVIITSVLEEKDEGLIAHVMYSLTMIISQV